MEIKIKVYAILLVTILALGGCKFGDPDIHNNYIVFRNNTDRDIYIAESWIYPDTVHLKHIFVLDHPDVYKIAAHHTNEKALNHDISCNYFYGHGATSMPYYENMFARLNDTMMVYVFDAEILENTRRYDNDAVLQRIYLSLDDLKRMHWVISYPLEKDDIKQ